MPRKALGQKYKRHTQAFGSWLMRTSGVEGRALIVISMATPTFWMAEEDGDPHLQCRNQTR